MMEFDLKVALLNLKKENENNEKVVQEMLEFFDKYNDFAFVRENKEGHFTGSALVVDSAGNILLNHHKKADIWIQFGGHCDGEKDVKNVALRETIEESGISPNDLNFLIDGVFDCAIYNIPANRTKGEPAHKHYDINFLIQTNSRDYAMSPESVELRWCTYKEALDLVKGDEACTRMIKKSRNYIKNNKK
ncbi:MAG: NUDIX hydrolase [Clostridia bacterium]|nr:NUDIX hydrolase [Clostridia bacterium]